MKETGASDKLPRGKEMLRAKERQFGRRLARVLRKVGITTLRRGSNMKIKV